MRITEPNRSRQTPLLKELVAIAGRQHVLRREGAMRRYVTGYRFGNGSAVAVVLPGSLVELWRVLQACVACDAVVIMQAANTGLTGGSTPRDSGYGRPAIVVNTARLKGIRIIGQGEQVVCLPGATLNELERALAPLGREPHSVIGSSCIGASVVGGVCNNSGGSLIRRGPAYTELSLYAKATNEGRLELVNALGIELGDEPEEMLRCLERGEYGSREIIRDPAKAASDPDYQHRVRDTGQPSPARYNANPERLHGASGSAGRIAVFAVRLDTFQAAVDAQTFYVGTNDPDALADLRFDILSHSGDLPVSCEYIHRDAFDMADLYGKDVFLAVRHLGTDRLPMLWAAKSSIDRLAQALGLKRVSLSDRLLQFVARLWPDHLSPRIRGFRNRYEHHLVLKTAGAGTAEMRGYLATASQRLASFECAPEEASQVMMHRFAVAGAAVRYKQMHARTVEDIVSIDVALPRNTRRWFERLPREVDEKIAAKAYYGHFFCNVFHQDYLVRKGQDLESVERAILASLDARGGEYPAEHNVGHHYRAKPELEAFYRELDPGNRFNPGIGKTSLEPNWQ